MSNSIDFTICHSQITTNHSPPHQSKIQTMFIIDAHLDLSMNALEWNRDLTQPVSAIRAREHGLSDKPDRGNGVVSLPALREGNIGLVVATQIARYVSPDNKLP